MRNKNFVYLEREQEKFANYLSYRGLKLSAGRQIVFKEVINTHGHFAAEELTQHCQKHNRKVSRATVYRSLKELLEAGVIRGTAFGEKHQHFEHVYDETLHHHAHCIRCHKNIEFPDLEEDTIYHPVIKRQGFKILGHELHFYGICRECQS